MKANGAAAAQIMKTNNDCTDFLYVSVHKPYVMNF